MDQQIVNAMKKKDEKGIQLLLQQYGGLIKSIIQKYLSGLPQETEECMADVIISIWYHIDEFDPSKNTLKNWVAAIAKFKSIDCLRKIERRKNTQDKFTSNQLDRSYEATTYSWQTILEELPETERAIFQKYYLEGFATKEIAAIYKMKDSWVHNKLSRGRKKIRNILMRNGV